MTVEEQLRAGRAARSAIRSATCQSSTCGGRRPRAAPGRVPCAAGRARGGGYSRWPPPRRWWPSPSAWSRSRLRPGSRPRRARARALRPAGRDLRPRRSRGSPPLLRRPQRLRVPWPAPRAGAERTGESPEGRLGDRGRNAHRQAARHHRPAGGEHLRRRDRRGRRPHVRAGFRQAHRRSRGGPSRSDPAANLVPAADQAGRHPRPDNDPARLPAAKRRRRQRHRALPRWHQARRVLPDAREPVVASPTTARSPWRSTPSPPGRC